MSTDQMKISIIDVVISYLSPVPSRLLRVFPRRLLSSPIIISHTKYTYIFFSLPPFFHPPSVQETRLSSDFWPDFLQLFHSHFKPFATSPFSSTYFSLFPHVLSSILLFLPILLILFHKCIFPTSSHITYPLLLLFHLQPYLLSLLLLSFHLFHFLASYLPRSSYFSALSFHLPVAFMQQGNISREFLRAGRK